MTGSVITLYESVASTCALEVPCIQQGIGGDIHPIDNRNNNSVSSWNLQHHRIPVIVTVEKYTPCCIILFYIS